jgi:hypothetical protein
VDGYKPIRRLTLDEMIEGMLQGSPAPDPNTVNMTVPEGSLSTLAEVCELFAWPVPGEEGSEQMNDCIGQAESSGGPAEYGSMRAEYGSEHDMTCFSERDDDYGSGE